MWLLVFKCFCFLGHFVYLVCCAGFPFVGAVLIVFVAIVWFALRGRVDLNMSNFSCLLLLLFSVCGCCSLAYFLLIYFCLLLSVVSVVYFLIYFCFAFVLLLLCFCLVCAYTHTHMHAYTQTHRSCAWCVRFIICVTMVCVFTFVCLFYFFVAVVCYPVFAYFCSIVRFCL